MALDSELIELRSNPTRRQQIGDTEIILPESGEGAEVYLNGAKPAQEPMLEGEAFDFNLAKLMTKNQRTTLAQKIVEYNRADRTSREEWLNTLRSGMELLGVGKLPDSKIPFEGAAEVQHPLIAEATAQFNAHAIEEYFPATGPVKCTNAGDTDAKGVAQSERVEAFMNYYLTVVDKGYFSDTDQMTFLLPIWGSVFRKGYIDPRTKQPRIRLVKCEDLIVPYDAPSIEEATRVGHEYSLSGNTIKRGIRNGVYAEVDMPDISSALQEPNPSRKIADLADQRVEVRHEDDRNYSMLEYHIDLTLPDGIDSHDDDQFELPYIVLVDKDNLEVLSVRRNWKESDQFRLKRNWFKHYKFFPGVGFYGWGFIHAIGALAHATGGSIRALLDSALFATLQGGFKSKEGGKLGGDKRMQPGVWQATEVPGEDINKMFFTPPFKEPSPALAKTIEILATEGRRFTTMSQSMIGEADNKAPVGTTLALIEQSMKLFTAIHKRMHASARGEFEMLAEMFAEFSSIDEYPYKVKGEQRFIFREDFDDRVDVLPVSDPNIFSNMMRISLCQARLELMNTNPQLYTRKQWAAAHRDMLIAMKIPNAEEAAPKDSGPKYLDPVSENAQAMVGVGVQAFPGQLHEAHIAVHQNWIEQIAARAEGDPELQMVVQALMAHCRSHEALMYREQIAAQMGIELPPFDITGEEGEDLPPDIEAMLSQAMAQRLLPPPPNPEDEAATQEVMDESARKDALALADIERRAAATMAEQARKDAEHAANLRRKDEEHAQNLRLAEQETSADIRLDTAKTTNVIKLTTAKAMNENLRADDKHERGESREDDRHARSQEREDANLGAATRREDEKHVRNLAREDDKHERGESRAQDKHDREQLRGDDRHDRDEERSQDSHDRGERRSDDAHERGQGREEDSHKRGERRQDDSHRRGEKRAESEHEQASRHSEEDHERAVEHAEDDHKRGVKFEAESHKQKLTHAEQDAKARQKAAAAKSSEKPKPKAKSKAKPKGKK